MRESLLDRGDAAGILTVDDIADFLWKLEIFLGYDLAVLDDIYGDVVVDECQDIQVQHINITFYLQNIFFPKLVAAGILNDGHGAVQLIQLKMMVNREALACSNMI